MERAVIRLEDFERTGTGDRTRYTVRLSADNELVIAGPEAAIAESISDAEFEVRIDPEGTAESWEERARPIRQRQLEALSQLAALERPEELLKEAPGAPSRERSLFVSLRRTSGSGTVFFFKAGNFVMPAGFSFFFTLPPVCGTFGTVLPASGDQDLFLHLGWPLGPIVRSSVLGGREWDAVVFAGPFPCTFFTQISPWFRIFGFSGGVCRLFEAGGQDVFGP